MEEITKSEVHIEGGGGLFLGGDIVISLKPTDRTSADSSPEGAGGYSSSCMSSYSSGDSF